MLMLILGFAIQVLGRIVIFYFLGESIFRAFGKEKASPLVIAVVGLVLVTVFRFVPILGFLISFFLSIVGWGAVIYTRFGTTENWFKRRS
jgi:hypothetical protein